MVKTKTFNVHRLKPLLPWLFVVAANRSNITQNQHLSCFSFLSPLTNNWLIISHMKCKNPSNMSNKPLKLVFSFLVLNNVLSRLMLLQHLHDSCHCFAVISHSTVSAHQYTQKHTRLKPWRNTLNPYFYSILAVLQKWDLRWDLFRSCACTLCDLWGCAPQSAASPLMTSEEDASSPSFTVSSQN